MKTVNSFYQFGNQVWFILGTNELEKIFHFRAFLDFKMRVKLSGFILSASTLQ